jgi:hypothetical protein
MGNAVSVPRDNGATTLLATTYVERNYSTHCHQVVPWHLVGALCKCEVTARLRLPGWRSYSARSMRNAISANYDAHGGRVDHNERRCRRDSCESKRECV